MDKNTIQTPSKGRIVLYRNNRPGFEEMPAIITKVHDADTIDLQGFGPAGGIYEVVRYAATPEEAEASSGLSWRWPPRV